LDLYKGLHVMIMAFLLIMVVDGKPLDSTFHFRNAYNCNSYAWMLETGAISPVDKRRVMKQKNLSAYCIPVKVSQKTTTFYD